MGQMTCHPLPFNNNQSAFTKPQTYAPASCLPTFCPERRVLDDFRHTYFPGTSVRDYNWPVRQTFCAPLETGNAVHYQQGNHYHRPGCHVNFYNCCTRVWRSVDHYYSPQKRPRMVEDNLPKSTEGSTDISGKKETAARKPLPSPPPLIRTCIKQKESKQLHLKKLVGRKTYEKDVLTEEHVSKNREPTSKIQVPVVDCSMAHRKISNGGYRSEFMKKFSDERNADIEQRNQNFIGPDEFETEPRNGSLNAKWTSLNDTQKSCKSTPGVEKKLCSNRQVEKQVEQQLPLQHTVERFHLATGENAQRLGQTTGLRKEKQRSVIVQNDNYKVNKRRHSHYESMPQEGQIMPQEGLKRSRSFPITERRDTCCDNGDDFYETKPKDHNAEYRVPLFKDCCERKTMVPKRLIQNGQQRHLSNGTVHPQLKFYPQPNTNLERHRSKSFDAPKIQTSTSQSLCQNLQPENFSYRTKKQSEVLCEPVLRDKSVEHGHVDLCSPTISGRYGHEHEAKVNFVSSNEKGPGPKSGHWEPVSYKNSSESLIGLASTRKEIRQQTLTDQSQVTMKIERIPQQQPNISKRGCNSDSSMLHFQENQPLSCDNTGYIPKYLDANQTGVLTHCDVSRDQGKKSPHVTNNQVTVGGKVRQFGNVTSSVSPNGPQIIGPISLSELQKRRTALSQSHVSFNNTRPNMSRILNNKTAVNDEKSHDQEAVEEPKLHRKDISSASLQQTALNFPEIEHQNHEVKISVVSNDYSNSVNSQSLKDEPAEQPMSQSQTLPPLPSGKDLDKIDSGCGGYAIDHCAMPRIVAVHSIVTNDESLKEQESDLFSLNDKKYWKDLLRKLTSDVDDSDESKTFKITQANSPEMNKVDDPKDIEYQQDNDSTMEQENESKPNELNKVNKWTLWKYLSTPSKDLTIEIKCPSTDCDEICDAKKKTQPVRRKLTVRELSDKILYTRERIKKEEIPWKKKLLVSLEATFIKRLRKTEKETGEKADNFILKENEDDDDSKETGERKKCNKQGKKRKTVAKS